MLFGLLCWDIHGVYALANISMLKPFDLPCVLGFVTWMVHRSVDPMDVTVSPIGSEGSDSFEICSDSIGAGSELGTSRIDDSEVMSDASGISVDGNSEPGYDVAQASPMTRVCSSMVEAIPSEHHALLRQNLLRLGAFGLLAVGSACSGTDLFFPALGMLTSILCASVGVPSFCWTNLWACEYDAMKQEWLQTVMGVHSVVADIHDLATGGLCRMVGGGQKVIGDIFLFSCGFSCKSVSFQNKNRKKYRGCTLRGSGTTGRTYRSALKTIRRLLPFFVFLENVSGLSSKDRKAVRRDLEKLGYMVLIVESDARARGIPVRRVRVWFIAVLAPGMDDAERYHFQHAANWIKTVTSRAPMHLSEFMLDRDDPDYAVWLDKMLSKTRSSKGAARGVKWRDLHRHVLAKHGKSNKDLQHIGKELHVKAFMACYCFTERERQCVLMDMLFHPHDHANTTSTIIWDISQSADRVPRGVDIAPTVLPSAKCVVRSEGGGLRRLFGLEGLFLQGFERQMCFDPEALTLFSDADLQHLAGNAYSVPQVHLALVVALCLFPVPGSPVELEQLRNRARGIPF